MVGPAEAATLQRTLVISPNWIGDAVMAQPLLQLLRQQQPQRPIDVLAPAAVASVWRAMAEVDQVIEAPFKHGKLQLRERWQFAQRLRQRGYAAAYVLPNTLKFALIPWLAGIPQRVGYLGEMRYGLLNVVHRHDKRRPLPMVPFYAALVQSPTAAPRLAATLPRPVLQSSSEQSNSVAQRYGLQPDRRLIVFAPGAEFGAAKRWPASHFAQLAGLIIATDPSTQIALLGASKDAPVGEDIVALAPAVINLCGRTQLNEAMALIARAALVVSNDSGLLHIASAYNRPIIALYGPTDPLHAPPFSDVARSMYLALDCAPCKQRECPLGHHRCMQDLSAQLVWQSVQSIV